MKWAEALVDIVVFALAAVMWGALLFWLYHPPIRECFEWGSIMSAIARRRA